MPATVAVGCQFGDEGKGKIIDFLAADADVVVRFQGGANAGHTVQVGDELYAFHLLPSGVLRNRTMNVIGNGVVIDPEQLLKEIDETRARGHPVKNLRISDRAHVVMPYHKVLDGLEEKLKGGLGAGTTLRGIGPAFEDKVGRFGIRMCDLIDPETLRAKLKTIVPIKQRVVDVFGGSERIDAEALSTEYEAYGKRLARSSETRPPGWTTRSSAESASYSKARKGLTCASTTASIPSGRRATASRAPRRSGPAWARSTSRTSSASRRPSHLASARGHSRRSSKDQSRNIQGDAAE